MGPPETPQKRHETLKKSLITEDELPFQWQDLGSGKPPLAFVGGVDCTYAQDGSKVIVTLVILNYPANKLVFEIYQTAKFAQRLAEPHRGLHEGPLVNSLLDHVREKCPQFMPQVILFHGRGILDYDGFGSACHVGISTGIPTIGVSSQMVLVDGIDIQAAHDIIEQGAECVALPGMSGDIWGMAFVPPGATDRCPLYVSPGHKVSLMTAIQIVKSTCTHAMPEPIRLAHETSLAYPDLNSHSITNGGHTSGKPNLPGRFEYVIGFCPMEDMSPQNKECMRVLVEYVRDRLVQHGLCVALETNVFRHQILVSASAGDFDLEAEREGMRKLWSTPDHITQKKRMELFLRADAVGFEGYGSPDFYLPCERARMVQAMLDQIKGVDPETKKIDTLLGLVTESLMTTNGKHQAAYLQDLSLLDALKRLEIIEVATPIHEPSKSRRLWAQVGAVWPLGAPIHALYEYYGSEIAFYFAWLDFFSLWLIIPSIVGLGIWFTRPEHETVDNDVTNTYFSGGMVLWGFLFLTFWRRQAAAYASSWGTLDLFGTHQVEEPNPRFTGYTRTSPITGNPEVHYDSWRRWVIHYPFSILVTFLMLLVAFSVMCLSLNLQGYVHSGSPIYIPDLSELAAPGGVFDPNAEFWYPSFIPVICHVLVIMVLNKTYRSMAEWLTDLENHKYRENYMSSLIWKRFLFEAFDCYIALFYIAFWEMDIVKLRGELKALYTADSLRRVFTESILPWILHKLGDRKRKSAAAKTKKDDTPTPDVGQSGMDGMDLVKEYTCEDYESFDDYLEMVIELGYVTLFAAAFPLAAPLSLVCNFIESRSDAFKLTFNCKRPEALRAQNIGPWLHIITAMVWLSAMTNVLVMGLTSEQLKTLFPGFFKAVGVGHKANRRGLQLMVAIEHGFFLIGLIITNIFNRVPAWVREDEMRREYEKKQALIQQRIQERKKNQ